MEVICDNCGKKFNKKPSHITNFNYCCTKCMGEHRQILYSGLNNPNSKYKIDENFMAEINTEFKAWLLGWICSDGSIKKGSIQISINNKDIDVLNLIRGEIDINIPITYVKNNMATLTINSKKWVKDILKHLNLETGSHKCYNLKEITIEDELFRHFVRGVIEGDGHINIDNPKVTITSCSNEFLNFLINKSKYPATTHKYENFYITTFNGVNGLDLLGWCYENSTFKMKRKEEAYHRLCCWTPILGGKGNSTKIDGFYVAKTLDNAVFPSKTRVSDSGYDLTLIDIWKTIGETTFYDTGIRVKPPFGYYFMVVPRSSLSKTGYRLVNSVGIIDRSYIGSIKVALQKVDKTMPDIELPAKLMQMILMPVIHITPEIVDDFEKTHRGDNGFGSTGV